MFTYLVLISLVSVSHGIRVHWNTNEGPIVPATSTVPPVPKPPYRDPAPVWEITSNDIENPNPFVYVLPPPSRPRYNPDNVNDIYPTRNASPTNFGHYVPPQAQPTNNYPQGNYNDINPHHHHNHQQQPQFQPQHPHQQTNSVVVPQLAVQYVANIGNRYYAIVPVTSHQDTLRYQHNNNLKPIFWKGDLQQEKPFGKYNAKLKKYKAFETKQKFIPYYQYVAPVPQRSTNVISTSVPPPPQQQHQPTQQPQQPQQQQHQQAQYNNGQSQPSTTPVQSNNNNGNRY